MECFWNWYALAKICKRVDENGRRHFEQELNVIANLDLEDNIKGIMTLLQIVMKL
jgi:hypothetical protein